MYYSIDLTFCLLLYFHNAKIIIMIIPFTGDGIHNTEDEDIDGDGVANQVDRDMDGKIQLL